MNDKIQVYQQLESYMLKYNDLKRVAVQDCKEDLVELPRYLPFQTKQIDTRMIAYTGDKIYVRQTVSKMLFRASQLLIRINPQYKLEIVYGYRALSIQQLLYKQIKQKLQKQYSGEQLIEAIHRYIAVPSVSGHPTGGAIDIQIVMDENPINFGTKIWQFTPKAYTYSPFISNVGQANRLLLRSIMLSVGFAPFDGEWWHFSFGDKEWAKYYNQPCAIYEQIEFKKEV
ncbi:MAG: M15 family metallopeptidase [Microgenomates group bacterium]